MWTSITSSVDKSFQGVSLGRVSQGLQGRLNQSNLTSVTVCNNWVKVLDIRIWCDRLHSWSRERPDTTTKEASWQTLS